MKRISSRFLFLPKIVFPVLWFGFLALFVAAALLNSNARLPLPAILAPFAMAVFGYVLMKKLVWDLVDEVWDGGDYLLVRNGGEEDAVRLSNIMNVSAALLTNPPRITLRLVTPCRFGKEVSFSPERPFTLNPFAKNPVAEDLIERVYRARAAGAV
jgi:hypothetical protein